MQSEGFCPSLTLMFANRLMNWVCLVLVPSPRELAQLSFELRFLTCVKIHYANAKTTPLMQINYPVINKERFYAKGSAINI